MSQAAGGTLLRHLLPQLESLAPLALAEDWDNVGLLLGSPEQAIGAVLCTIDYTDAVFAEAQALQQPRGSVLLLSYHPPWFKACKRLVGPGLLWRTADAGMAVYSPHTALDAAQGGVNDVLAQACGITGAQPLVPHRPGAAETDADANGASDNGKTTNSHINASGLGTAGLGQGRIGNLPQPQALTPWLQALKSTLKLPAVLLAAVPGDSDGQQAKAVQRVAVAAGAGSALLAQAHAQGADTFVTGELRHHDALAAQAMGMRVVALRHSASERAVLPPLAARLRQLCPTLAVHISRADADPFAFA